jgi:hypothetical protein
MTGVRPIRIWLSLVMILSWGDVPLSAAEDARAVVRNGFLLSGASVALEEIRSGGPGRDGIPALVAPRVVSAASAPWRADERIIGIVIKGTARAYPIAVLNWHELVNDALAGVPVLVSYCPLCGTGMVFRREFSGRTLTFGVSGLLYRSDLLLFDRETESLWSQIASVAVTGAAIGTRLELIRSHHSTWGDWRKAHPETTVLSHKTGFRRDYRRSPYGDYSTSDRLLFPVPSGSEVDSRYPKKMLTLGIRTAGGVARAYPAVEILAAGGTVRERLDGAVVTVSYSSEKATFETSAPSRFEVIEGYWFAWRAFHPESTVFVAAPPVSPTVAY